MTVQSLNHYTIRPANLEATKQFYVDVLGLEVGSRPPFNFPGYWLYRNGTPIVHLIGKREGNPVYATEPNDTGRLDHVAFLCQGLPGMRERLHRHAVKFEERVVPMLNQVQLFVVDPNGLQVELNFSEAAV